MGVQVLHRDRGPRSGAPGPRPRALGPFFAPSLLDISTLDSAVGGVGYLWEQADPLGHAYG